MTDPKPDSFPPDAEIDREMRRRTRRSFLVGGLAAAAGLAGLEWIASRPLEDGLAWPLRRVLRVNEKIARSLYSQGRGAREYPLDQAVRTVRVNEDIGMPEEVDPEDWPVLVEGAASGSLKTSLQEIQQLPKVEFVTELKCVEGWSQKVHWGGARFADFVKKFPAHGNAQYVGMETPSRGYYVGLDMASAIHPQTLLCYEMNGKPLELEHGAPLRLAIPSKYGIKNIKGVGRITFADQRPRDYWEERGYDWYAGV